MQLRITRIFHLQYLYVYIIGKYYLYLVLLLYLYLRETRAFGSGFICSIMVLW